MGSEILPRHVLLDPTPEIFATDSSGVFFFPLTERGEASFDTVDYDEARFVVSIWHPSSKVSIDLDRAYAELRGSFDPEEGHWIKLAEIEPVVPPYAPGDAFDGWIVLPILAAASSFALFGSGFEARTRIQVRVSAYLVP